MSADLSVPDEDSPRWLPEAPPANTPTYPVGGLNQSIPLYQGEVELERDSSTIRGEGCFRFDWFPTPRIAFDITVADMPWLEGTGKVRLKLADGRELPHGRVSSWGFNNQEAVSGTLKGRVERFPSPTSGQRYARITFLVPNFHEMYGAGILYTNGCVRTGRVELSVGEWKIVLDTINHPSGFWGELEGNRGFAVTHAGLLERTDGGSFSWDEAWSILRGLSWFLSWSVGRWTGPILSCGLTPGGERLFESWDVSRIGPARPVHTWVDQQHVDHLVGSFPGFMRLWLDESWSEVLRLAVHWYVEANAQAGSAEGSIVLTQTAFEMLAFKAVVAENRWVSPKAFEPGGLEAVDRIRLLFVWAGLPLTIPDTQAHLAKLAKSRGWEDIPQALVGVRNPLTHPTSKNLDRFRSYPPDAIQEAWNLGLWALELILLKLCEYDGTYGCRLALRYSGEVQRVPYAR